MWFVAGTDTTTVIPQLKQFIKDKIETISDNGTNQIHISNLMREIEYSYSYVDHIRFRGFNDYSTDYQSIKLKHTNIDDLDTLVDISIKRTLFRNIIKRYRRRRSKRRFSSARGA